MRLNVSGHPMTQGLQFQQTSLRITSPLYIPRSSVNHSKAAIEKPGTASNSPILTIQRSTSPHAFLQRRPTKLPVAAAWALRAPVIATQALAEGRDGIFPLCDGVEAVEPGECGGGAGCEEEEGCKGDVHS